MGKPTKAEGAKALKGAAAVMKALCDCCCDDCTPAQCAKEAQAIVDAIVKAWNDNYGNGSNTGEDNIGGYLCWDWARFYRDAALSTKPKCWKAECQMAWKGPRNGAKWQACHWWVALWACEKTDECKVMIDDEWFDDDFVHQPPWPGKKWPLGKMKLPPLTPKK